jgi:hypothetical protein
MVFHLCDYAARRTFFSVDDVEGRHYLVRPRSPGADPAAHLSHAWRQMSFTVARSELAASGDDRAWFRAHLQMLAGVPARPGREQA